MPGSATFEGTPKFSIKGMFSDLFKVVKKNNEEKKNCI